MQIILGLSLGRCLLIWPVTEPSLRTLSYCIPHHGLETGHQKLRRRRAARNLADAVGGTDWRGWQGPSQAAWQKLEAQTLWDHTGRLKERQACRRSMAGQCIHSQVAEEG